MKKDILKNIFENIQLVEETGRDGGRGSIEKFAYDLYGSSTLKTINSVRGNMSSKAITSHHQLSSTHNALELHVQRANNQAKSWLLTEMETIVVILPTDACKRNQVV